MDLCKYKNILGVPGKGFHKHFGVGFAILDLLATIIIAYVLSKIIGKSFLKVFLSIMIIATFLHWLFCVKTKLNVFFYL